MNVTYLSQDERFYLKIAPEACARLPDGSFNPGMTVPAYAIRIDGSGTDKSTYFLVPAADGAFHWVPMTDCRLARQ